MGSVAFARVLPASRPSEVDEGPGLCGIPGSLSGSVLGRYKVTTFMGRGGMADVYAARPISPGGKVAIKRMLPRLATQPRLVELFLHEAELACRLVHPNLVRCLDFGTADGVPFMALEFVDGIPCDALQHWLSRRRAFPPRMALAVVGGVLRGLAYAHEARDERGQSLGIVHLDVSPDNILISREGEVKLTDFGVAQSSFTLAPAASQELRGKPGYMSPEQIIGMPMDQRSDVFSVGVVLAEFLLRCHVFEAKDPLDLMVRNYNRESEALSQLSEAPRVVAELVRVATARLPEERFQSSRDFLGALYQAATELGGLPDAEELAQWLVEEELVPRASGVYDMGGVSVPTDDVFEKIDEVRPTRTPELTHERPASRRLRAVSTPPRPPRLRLRNTTDERPDTCSFSRMVERLVTGSAGPGSEVAQDDGPFVSIQSISPLARVAKVAAYRFDDGVVRRAAWTAALDRARLPSILHDLETRGARGVLSLSSGARLKRIYFDGGCPVFVSSTDPAELFGRRLVALGILDVEELEEVVSRATHQGLRLGQALVAARILPAASVLRLLVAELDRRVLEIGCWTEGEVSFTAGARPGLAVPSELGPPSRLACQLVRSSYCDPEVESFLLRDATGPIAALRHNEAAATGLLTDIERSVIERAGGRLSYVDLVAGLSADGVARPEQSRRALFLGLSLGLLVTPGWPRGPRFPSSSCGTPLIAPIRTKPIEKS